MAIVKSGFRAGDLSPSADGSSDGDSGARTATGASSPSATDCGTDSCSDADSGMGSDVYDLSEVGEAGAEFCQVGNQTCSVPLDLYNLPDLRHVLSLDAWNMLLTEKERLSLADYLPDMDQETFVLTLTELLSGANFHFASPLHELQEKLKGGHCEPRVVLNRKASLLLQKHRHYHLIRKYHDGMVGRLFRIRNAWRGCEGYSMDEKLRVLKTSKFPGKKQQPLAVMKREGGFRGDARSESDEFIQLATNKKLKLGRQALPPSKLPADGLHHGRGVTWKDNPKGILKVVQSKGPLKRSTVASADHYPLPGKHGLDVNNKPPVPLFNGRVPRYGEDDYCDLNDGYMPDDPAPKGDVKKSSLSKSVKKQGFLRQYSKETERHSESQHSHAKKRKLEETVTIASHVLPRNLKYSDKELSRGSRPLKGWAHQVQADWSAGRQALQMNNAFEEVAPINEQVELDDWNIQGRKLKAGAKNKFNSGSKSEHNKFGLPQTGHSSMDYNHGIKVSDERHRGKSGRNDGKHNEYSRTCSLLAQSEETESDSSDNAEDIPDIKPVVRKSRFPGSLAHGPHFGGGKSFHNPSVDVKIVKKNSELQSSYGGEDMGIHEPEVDSFSLKGKKKGKTSVPDHSLEKNFPKEGRINNKLKLPAVKTHFPEKKRKRTNSLDQSSPSNFVHEFGNDPVDEEPDFRGESLPVASQLKIGTHGNRIQEDVTYYPEYDQFPKTNVPLSACSSLTKKRKAKLENVYLDDEDESAYLQSSPLKLVDNSSSPVKRKGKSNVERETVPLTGTADQATSDKATAETDTETKIQKKQFIAISPTVHTGFSFSIIHLLSAVRKSFVTPALENAMGSTSHLKKDDRRVKEREDKNRSIQAGSCMNASNSHENMDANMLTHAGEKHSTPLTVQEIVNYVRSNPGDPRILETQEPLHDLVRGVLKIFSSKTAPLGAKGWRAIVSYDKANKTWYWVGPVSYYSLEADIAEEDLSIEAWGFPHKMLVKLVDAYANWLKNGQETLQQIGSLPAPPIIAPVLGEKERFKDLRAQKSLNTINPSSDEAREYFRKEEHLRYSIPDRAFHYTAADGKKSIVAPLRRGGGKPTSKARDHFMLKPDRPPHVTILCLVRDAAARLPGSIGTRADACTLIRDSQYIVEDVSDAQVNQVVSGALDRLHYERDPCVQYDSDRKLWVYLHRDREEEDFEDDGTSSTKKWKRQRKDPNDGSDTGMYDMNSAGDPTPGVSSTGYDFIPDSNVDTGEKSEPLYNDMRSQMDNVQSFIDPVSNNRSLGNADRWGILGMNPLHENIFCQENSINEDFDDESYSRDRPVGLFGALL